MKYKAIGPSKLRVSALGLGCMSLSPFYKDVQERNAIETVVKAYQEGITLFDVADIYGFGASEKILGKAIRPYRDNVVIASKAGIVIDNRGGSPKLCGTNTTPAYLKAACERSLKRMDVDYIDLYYLHRIDPVTPIEDSIQALVELISEGKIRYIGLSQATVQQIRAAHCIYPITAVQSEYSLWFRQPEVDGVLQACQELNIGFIPYSPLGRGFLTGTIKNLKTLRHSDFRRKLPRFQEETFQKNLVLIDELTNFAKELKCTLPQLALAWLLMKGDSIIPIPGTSTIKYLLENNKAVEMSLGSSVLKQLEKSFPVDRPAGDQFPKAAFDLFATYISEPSILKSAQSLQ